MADLAVHPHLRRIEVDTPNGPGQLSRAGRDRCRPAGITARCPRSARPLIAKRPGPNRHERTKLDLDHLRQWIGRTDRSIRHRHRATCEGLARDAVPGDRRAQDRRCRRRSPPIGAWPSRCSRCRSSAPTAIPSRGGFLPPVPLPRRMWAGGELEFVDTLRVGDEAKRVSRISDVTMKTGCTGTLCFVSVDHEVTTPRGVAIRERQDIVYRDVTGAAPAPPKAPPPPPSPSTARPMCRSGAAVSLFGADLQWPPHPLRPRLCHQGRGLSGSDLSRPAAGDVYRGIGGETSWRHSRRRSSAIAGVQPLFEGSEFSINANPTPIRGWNCGPRMRPASPR